MTKLTLILLLVSLVHAQLNGEFWWLNSKLNNYRNVQPPEPEIEVSDESETDESSKIIFKDGLKSNMVNKFDNYVPREEHKVIWPNDRVNTCSQNFKEEMKMPEPIMSEANGDEFSLSIPIFDTNMTATNETNIQSAAETTTEENKYPENFKGNKNSQKVNSDIIFSNDVVLINHVSDKESQSICTYLTKKECQIKSGIVYDYTYRKNNIPEDQRRICCILPLAPKNTENDSNEIPTIFFPDNINKVKIKKRIKRDENKAPSQRNFLLLHRLKTQSQKKPSTPATRIVTPSDDDFDPYWNIKNSNFQNKEKDQTKHEYVSDENSDYKDELPKPGLVGLYSDQVKSPASWTYTYGESDGETYDDDDGYDEEEDEEVGFGYSTVDPRKAGKIRIHKGKPVRLSTFSDEISSNAESQTINFQSNPDFNVLQGFKLLNLVKNKNNKNIKRTNFEKIASEKEVFVSEPDLISEDDDGEFFEEEQLFGDCGNSVSIRNDEGKQVGDASNGSHPWLVLVVLTKRKQSILCYGTLIHPRAAITVADCVEGTAPKEITVIAGLWDLNDRSQSKSRVATVHVHPRYRAGNFDNNLAILYWVRPLKLGTNIQPACLSEPHPDDECKFYGWGSFDKGIQTRSKWQKATIRSCNSGSRLNKRDFSEIFCATVARGVVTGFGGPLICNSDRRSSVVGVIVSRDQKYLLLPVHEFGIKSSELLV